MSDFLTKKEFEVWKQNFEKRLNSILSRFQEGITTVTPLFDATVTFQYEFTSVPKITTGVISANQQAYARAHTITKTGFKLFVYNHTSGSAVIVHWIAKI